ncbi:hypothetical protein [Roseiconus lacunae]|uniref:Uncharacterized protein n=1 Tax=Roseiconus lacunae TaxID=2605694 RepID=A0ABT7PQL2_9BACT|nr:hypothetical protein [Roseiconus lacunae]MDM4018768.1 hypothetical protein [Roseiconus lacunae]
MFSARFWGSLASIFMLLPAAAPACDDCAKCNGTGSCTKVVQVPCTVMKTVTETCYREEQRIETVLVPKTITVEKQVPYEYNALVCVEKVDEQVIEVKTPKFRWVDQEYEMMVSAKDTVTKMRKRTECVPVTETKTCVEDQGCWKIEMVASETCGGCKCTEKKVWCPNPVEVTKEVTVMKEVCVEEPYTCEVDIMVPIKKTRKVKEYFTKTETKTIKHPYKSMEYRKKTKMVTASIPECVQVEEQRTVTVKVPYTVEKQVPCTVMKTVEQTCACDCGCGS